MQTKAETLDRFIGRLSGWVGLPMVVVSIIGRRRYFLSKPQILVAQAFRR